MTEIVNESQQVRVGLIYPPSLYKRTVSLLAVPSSAVGWTVEATPQLASSIWLWSVKLTLCDRTVNKANINLINFYTGIGPKPSVQEITHWENLLPAYHPNGTIYNWQFYDGCSGSYWTIDRHYLGQGRRFAILVNRIGAGVSLLYVTFTYSEG